MLHCKIIAFISGPYLQSEIIYEYFVGSISFMTRIFYILKLFPKQIKVIHFLGGGCLGFWGFLIIFFFFFTFPCCSGIENFHTWKNQTTF